MEEKLNLTDRDGEKKLEREEMANFLMRNKFKRKKRGGCMSIKREKDRS